MQETRVWSLGWEDPLEKEMGTHSNILAWKTPWTDEPGRLQSMGSQRVGYDWATSLSLSYYLKYSPLEVYSAYPLTVTSTKTHWQTNSASIHFSSLMWRLPLSPSHLKGVFWVEMPWSEVKSLSHVWLSVTPWTVAYQAHLSMGFSRQQYWSGLPFPSPGDLPNPGIELRSPAL